MPTERKIAEWSEEPYSSYDRRRATVYHRVMLFVYENGVDLEHQVRGDERAAVSGEWSPAQVWEVRNGRVQKVREKEVLRT
jgi:hypothetical protein